MKGLAAALFSATLLLAGQSPDGQAAKIQEQIKHLRDLPDAERANVTRRLAIEIREVPDASREELALDLANLATEGDFGRDTLQQVATTLAQAIAVKGKPESYITLAQLVRYEHVQVAHENPALKAALAQLAADDAARERADFTLKDLSGKIWNLKSLSGSVVLVNFWATWCPPCRKEMPDLESLYQEFGSRGFVILGISDEDAVKVAPFIAGRRVTYPVLLDPGRKVNQLFRVEGIPKSFLYDRTGALVAEAIDMRTRAQFLEMLRRAGLHD